MYISTLLNMLDVNMLDVNVPFNVLDVRILTVVTSSVIHWCGKQCDSQSVYHGSFCRSNDYVIDRTGSQCYTLCIYTNVFIVVVCCCL
jgi:hypothetical protein